MFRTVTVIAGAAGSIVIVTAAVWVWQGALHFSAVAAKPEIALWSARSAAVAMAAVAQVMLLTLVMSRIYQRDAFSRLLQIVAALVGGAGVVSAAVLGLASR
jgi:hypothetical protein